jgi:hypothetical protein
MTSTGATSQDMGQNETAQNGGAVKTEPRSPRLWILIVGICAVFFSFRGAIELLPPRFRGNTFGLWVFLAILLAPFAGVSYFADCAEPRNTQHLESVWRGCGF